MPFGSVTLIPGVNVERTPTLAQAMVSQSQLIRYKDSLIQKYGGWEQYYPFAVPGVPRDLHAWQDLNVIDHLAVGTTTELAVITQGSLINITPQTQTTNPPVNFTTIAASKTVSIVDNTISGLSQFDSVVINTPVSVGGIILSGPYVITSVIGNTYTIIAASPATGNINNGGTVPVFTTTISSILVSVALANHGLAVNNVAVFAAPTTGNGVTIQGSYAVIAVADPNDFTIALSQQATASGSFSMNGGNAQFVYYIAISPLPTGVGGYGTGGYGAGGYGVGGATPTPPPGSPINATDWTSDNWGQILLECPTGGGVYQWDPTGGFQNAGLVGTAPPYNTGIFISQQQQILVCYGSTATEDIGVIQDPLLVAWSTVGDFTDFAPLVTNQAGSQRLPIGSKCVSGMAVANLNVIWTDLDVWGMTYIGPPFVFGFNILGAGAGAISLHSPQKLRGNVYWMGQSNFYSLSGNGVNVLPCPVWDFVFQNLNTSFQQNVRSMPNTPFNEVGWLFPSSASTDGECDSYVKFNITEPGSPWDFGLLDRSAWTDQSVLGNPIGAVDSGIIYQHETTNDAAGQALVSSFTTGYFELAEGEDFVFVDQILPDFRWGFFEQSQSAQIQLTFNVINFPGDTPVSFGPFTVMQSTEILSVRFRGRQVSITVASSDVGSFWRLGKVRYRYSPVGRR